MNRSKPAVPILDLPHCARWLWGLLVLFYLRVLAQLVARSYELPYLPSFERWHSAVLPYPVLFAIQLSILSLMLRMAWAVTHRTVRPHRRLGVGLLVFGAVYWSAMVTRLVMGFTLFPESRFFTNWLPIFFHMVIAMFVLLSGYVHARYARGGSTHAHSN